MKTKVRLAAMSLAISLSLFAPSIQAFTATGDTSSVTFQWHPTPSQQHLWTQAKEKGKRPLPRVSLKIALPAGTAGVSLTVVTEAWRVVALQSSYAVTRPSTPAATLGQFGFWHGVRYQEIIVSPLQPAEDGSTARLMTHLAFRLTYQVPAGCAQSTAAFPARFLPQELLFLNPSTAAMAETAGTLVPSGPSAPPYGTTPTGLRLSVSQDGIIRMDKAHLPAALTSGDPRDLHLRCRGVEIPIVVEGEGDGSFDPSDAVVFYGQKLSIRDRDIWNGGDFTDTNVYWLTLEGTPGLRMASVESEPTQGFPIPPSFDTTVHVEQNDFFVTAYHFNPNRDLWYMLPYYGGSPGASGTYAATIPHACSSAAQVTGHILGWANVSHAVHITLNGAAPSSGGNPATWSGASLTMQTWDFISGLQSGSNTLALFSDLGDYQLPDYFDVTYGRTFEADSNALLITDANVNAQYVSAGYSGAPYVLDLSQADPSTGLYLPKLLTGATFASGTVTFEMAADPSVSSRRVALSSAPLLPDAAEMASGRNLSDPALGADLLIITHPDFHPDGQDQVWLDYLARREAQMQVQVVDIQDVYDNFSDGIMDPTAIRTFLQAAAANWAPVPKYVLLIGDSSWDYKNYLQDPTFKSWVPTMMFEDLGDSTYMGRYPSDAWYADVHGDGFPDMAVGRLPARSYDQFAAMLTKIMAYEDQALSGTWYKTGLFVADTWNESWEQVFETYNSELQATYTTPPWQNLHVYFHDPPYDGVDANACAADIRAAWDQSAIVHYDGHSGIQSWGKSHAIFTAFPSRTCGTGTCSDVDLLAPISLPYGPAPLHDGKMLSPPEFEALDAEERQRLEAAMERASQMAVAADGDIYLMIAV